MRVNDLPAGGKLTMSAAEYRLAKAALNQLRTQRLAEGGYTDAVDDALTRLCCTPTRRCLSGESGYDMGKFWSIIDRVRARRYCGSTIMVSVLLRGLINCWIVGLSFGFEFFCQQLSASTSTKMVVTTIR